MKLSEGGQWKITVLGEEERAGKVPKKSEGKRKWKKKVKKVDTATVPVEEVESDSEEEVEVEAEVEEELKEEQAPLAGTGSLGSLGARPSFSKLITNYHFARRYPDNNPPSTHIRYQSRNYRRIRVRQTFTNPTE